MEQLGGGRVCACMCVHVCMRVCGYVCMRACVHVCVCACVCAGMCACVCVCMCVCVCVCVCWAGVVTQGSASAPEGARLCVLVSPGKWREVVVSQERFLENGPFPLFLLSFLSLSEK